jgi:hypothetical protein
MTAVMTIKHNDARRVVKYFGKALEISIPAGMLFYVKFNMTWSNKISRPVKNVASL